MEAIAMKEPEGIVEATQAVIQYMQSDKQLNTDEWAVTTHFFYIEIEKSTPEAILVDSNLELPFFIKCDLHQKLVYLDDNSNNLTRFADFLRFYGPSWNYLADYFEKIVATRAQYQLNFKN
jgi:DNA polymerase sigma